MERISGVTSTQGACPAIGVSLTPMSSPTPNPAYSPQLSRAAPARFTWLGDGHPCPHRQGVRK